MQPITERGLPYLLLKTALVSVIIAGVVLATAGICWWEVRPHSASGSKLAIALAQNFLKSGTDTATDVFQKFVGISQAEHADDFVQSKVGTLRGEVTVNGWTAKEVAPNQYLVSFEWANAGDSWGMYFEVNTANRYVRSVIPDDVLALKYGVCTKEEYDKLEAGTRQRIDKLVGGGTLKVTYADHTISAAAPPNLPYSAMDFAQSLYKQAKPAMSDRKDRYLKVSVTKGTATETFDGSEP